VSFWCHTLGLGNQDLFDRLPECRPWSPCPIFEKIAFYFGGYAENHPQTALCRQSFYSRNIKKEHRLQVSSTGVTPLRRWRPIATSQTRRKPSSKVPRRHFAKIIKDLSTPPMLSRFLLWRFSSSICRRNFSDFIFNSAASTVGTTCFWVRS